MYHESCHSTYCLSLCISGITNRHNSPAEKVGLLLAINLIRPAVIIKRPVSLASTDVLFVMGRE